MATYEEVKDVIAIQEANTAALEAKANVSGTAVGHKVVGGNLTNEVCVQVLVTDKKPVEELDSGDIVPQQVEGIATDVVVVGDISPLGVRDKARPAMSGHSISPDNRSYSGTLGARVIDNVNDQAALLTNNHVAADENSLPLGQQIVQPSIPDGGIDGMDEIATLTRFIPITFTTSASNQVDGAVCDLITDSFVDATLFGEHDINPVVRQAEIDMFVKKVGRTTDMTYGRILSLNATVLINYTSGVARFIGQIITTHMSNPGDSGSLIVDRVENRPIGLLFAGSDFVTVANPIPTVNTALNIRFGNTGNFSQRILAEYTRGSTNQYRIEPVSKIDGWLRTSPDRFRMYKNPGVGFTAQYLWYHPWGNNYVVAPLSIAPKLPQYLNLRLLGYTANTAQVDDTPETVELKVVFNIATKRHKLILGTDPFEPGQDGYYPAISLGFVRTADAIVNENFEEVTIAEFQKTCVYYYARDPVEQLGSYARTLPDVFQLYVESGPNFTAQHLWYDQRIDNYCVVPGYFGPILPSYKDLGILGYTADNASVDPSPQTTMLKCVFNIDTKRHKLVYADDFTPGDNGFAGGPDLGYVRRVV